MPRGLSASVATASASVLRLGWLAAGRTNALPRDDQHAVGGVDDRFVLFIPTHSVALVRAAAEQSDDLSAARRLPVHAARFDPVADVGAACRCLLGDHACDLPRW